MAYMRKIIVSFTVNATAKTSLHLKDTTYSHIFLFAKEAHGNIIPEWCRLRCLAGCHSVFGECHVVVPMRLHHAACSQDGPHIGRLIGEGIPQVFEGLLVLSNLEQQKRKVAKVGVGVG